MDRRDFFAFLFAPIVTSRESNLMPQQPAEVPLIPPDLVDADRQLQRLSAHLEQARTELRALEDAVDWNDDDDWLSDDWTPECRETDEPLLMTCEGCGHSWPAEYTRLGTRTEPFDGIVQVRNCASCGGVRLRMTQGGVALGNITFGL